MKQSELGGAMKRTLIPIPCAAACAGAADYPAPSEDLRAATQFHFSRGETLPELRTNYFAPGSPKHDANGRPLTPC